MCKGVEGTGIWGTSPLANLCSISPCLISFLVIISIAAIVGLVRVAFGICFIRLISFRSPIRCKASFINFCCNSLWGLNLLPFSWPFSTTSSSAWLFSSTWVGNLPERLLTRLGWTRPNILLSLLLVTFWCMNAGLRSFFIWLSISEMSFEVGVRMARGIIGDWGNLFCKISETSFSSFPFWDMNGGGLTLCAKWEFKFGVDCWVMDCFMMDDKFDWGFIISLPSIFSFVKAEAETRPCWFSMIDFWLISATESGNDCSIFLTSTIEFDFCTLSVKGNWKFWDIFCCSFLMMTFSGRISGTFISNSWEVGNGTTGAKAGPGAAWMGASATAKAAWGLGITPTGFCVICGGLWIRRGSQESLWPPFPCHFGFDLK